MVIAKVFKRLQKFHSSSWRSLAFLQFSFLFLLTLQDSTPKFWNFNYSILPIFLSVYPLEKKRKLAPCAWAAHFNSRYKILLFSKRALKFYSRSTFPDCSDSSQVPKGERHTNQAHVTLYLRKEKTKDRIWTSSVFCTRISFPKFWSEILVQIWESALCSMISE